MINYIIVTVLCAILYRLGGMGGAWWKNTKMRDLGVPIVCLGYMLQYTATPWYYHALAFILLFAALTTYWDKVFKHDNFYAHGFMIGLAYLPYGSGIAPVRALVVCMAMGILCQLSENDWVEELGRGAIIGLTLPLLFL